MKKKTNKAKPLPMEPPTAQRIPFSGPPPNYEDLQKILQRDTGKKISKAQARRFGKFLIQITKALD